MFSFGQEARSCRPTDCVLLIAAVDAVVAVDAIDILAVFETDVVCIDFIQAGVQRGIAATSVVLLFDLNTVTISFSDKSLFLGLHKGLQLEHTYRRWA